MQSKHHTEGGTRLYQPYENDRNVNMDGMIQDIIREVFGANKCIVGHHIVFQIEERVYSQQTGQHHTHYTTQELPCADGLIFDHFIARKIWRDDWQANLTHLALVPVETRDALMRRLYYGRNCTEPKA